MLGGSAAGTSAAGGSGAGGSAAGGSAADGAREPRTWQEQRLDAERRIVLAALERHDWQITRTAESLGLADHASLLKIMRRLGVRRDG